MSRNNHYSLESERKPRDSRSLIFPDSIFNSIKLFYWYWSCVNPNGNLNIIYEKWMNKQEMQDNVNEIRKRSS